MQRNEVLHATWWRNLQNTVLENAAKLGRSDDNLTLVRDTGIPGEEWVRHFQGLMGGMRVYECKAFFRGDGDLLTLDRSSIWTTLHNKLLKMMLCEPSPHGAKKTTRW